LATTTLILGTLAPAASANGRNPGSLLIYPVQRSGGGLFTILCVTNTNRTPQTPISFGGSTNVQYLYFNTTPNPANPFQSLACTEFNRREFLTPADTLCVLTTCHNAVTANGQQGYAVVVAEDPSQFQVAWSHNFLVGSEIVINASGSTYSINAIPFSSPVAQGLATDLNANGQFDLDGAEYEGVPETLIIDSFIGVAAAQLALVNLTGNGLDLNTVFFSVWNDNEFPLSATLSFNCWFDLPLFLVAPLFGQGFLVTIPNDPNELDLNCDGVGDLETGWAVIDSIGVRSPGGNLVDADGAMVGAITAGFLPGGRLLWEDPNLQLNGSIFTP
jgi:hypothetical protein